VKSHGLTDPGVIFLPKPYDVKTLAGAVRNCLDQASPFRADRAR
jgi:hypothetical protein